MVSEEVVSLSPAYQSLAVTYSLALLLSPAHRLATFLAAKIVRLAGDPPILALLRPLRGNVRQENEQCIGLSRLIYQLIKAVREDAFNLENTASQVFRDRRLGLS